MKQQVFDILKDLVACDTQNPPREISADGPAFQVLQKWLADEVEFQVQDFAKGRVNWLVTRGNPTRLFNVHLDTVPVGDGWTKPPLNLTVDQERVYGRGVCDIKGAAACLIAAANSARDVAILFSSDEEGAESCCVAEFCRAGLADPFESIVVAEPTGCHAVAGHRGYLSLKGTFCGEAGHTSQHQLLPRSANHQAARWVCSALQSVAEYESTELGGQSACFNVGRIDGGVKNNVVADRCLVTWSARLPAGCSNQVLLESLQRNNDQSTNWNATFDGSPLPANANQREKTLQLCHRLGLPVAADVDFWTEAAIFAATGKPTFVLGPGNIAQAHAADEWVAIDQLETCANLYLQLMTDQEQTNS